MRKQRHSTEQIIGKLREAEVLQGKGMSMEEVVRQLGVSEATYDKCPRASGHLSLRRTSCIPHQRQPSSKEQQPARLHKVPYRINDSPHRYSEVTPLKRASGTFACSFKAAQHSIG